MRKIRQNKYLLAIVALVLVFAGCKGESPTAPSTGGQGGGITPPTNATVALSVSNPTPLVDSTTVITANVSQSGQPVPNGTAVQFATSLGTFTEVNANAAIRTTTNGVATITLTSSSAGTANITATVTNVSATTKVTFSTKPVTPPPPNTNPTITGINPTTGKPAGGDIITITGTNFVAPVRAIFDFGNGVTKEAQVISVTPTQIQVISPPIDLGTGQAANATITIISAAGTATEQKVSATTTFTYQAAVLTPKITTVSPTSGPIDGGTRVTIFGEGFQAPVQVFFGSQDAQVINVTFNQIIVMSPNARDTASNGSGTVTGPVDIKIININSATNVTATGAFRYTPKMQITAAGPTEGPFTGGTRVTIDGVGFNDPVAVTIGGVAAQPIKVTGTEIIAVTSAVAVTGCGDVTGAISVTNVDNGDTATGPSFIYRVPKPTILSVSSNNSLGGQMTVTVIHAFGVPRLTLGTTNLPITSSTTNAATDTTVFTTTVPSTLTLTTQACAGVAGASMQVPTAFSVTYTSATTGCTDTLNNGLVVTPPSAPALFVTPATLTLSATAANPAATPPVPAVNGSSTETLANTGTAPLIISGVATSSSTTTPNPFGATAPGLTTLAPCQSTALIVSYQATASGQTDLGTLSVTSNGGNAAVPLSGSTK